MRVKWNRNLDGSPVSGDVNSEVVNGNQTVSDATSNENIVNGDEASNEISRMTNANDNEQQQRMAVKMKRDQFEDDKRLNKLTTLLNIFKINNAKTRKYDSNETPTAAFTLPRNKPRNANVTEYGNHLFTTDSKRRRRANNLLLRNSAVRRSWHQLCTQNHKSSMVSSTPSTPLFYRNGKSPSIRSSSPSDSFLRSLQTADEADSVTTMQHDSVDSAVELDSHISDDGSLSLQQNSNLLSHASNTYNVRYDNSIELNRENDSVKLDGKVTTKANDAKTKSSSMIVVTERVVANGPPLTSVVHNSNNDLIKYENQISLNVQVLDAKELGTKLSTEANDECTPRSPFDGVTRTDNAIKSISATTASSYSRSSAVDEEDTIIHSRLKEFHSEGNDAIQFSDNNDANHHSFISHKEDERENSGEPSKTDDIVKVTVKKALVPEIVNISQKNGETSITPLVKFDGDEPVAIGYNGNKERDVLIQQQQQSIQGILKDRSNGSVIGTTLKSSIPKKVHFAETTRLRTKTALIANAAKNGGKPTNTTVTTSSTCSSLEAAGVTTITTTATVELKKNSNTSKFMNAIIHKTNAFVRNT